MGKKEYIAIVDAIFSILAVIITNHIQPTLVEEILAITAIVQPVIIMIINAIIKEEILRLEAHLR